MLIIECMNNSLICSAVWCIFFIDFYINIGAKTVFSGAFTAVKTCLLRKETKLYQRTHCASNI